MGKQYLQKKYARIQTAQVRSIGLDEIYVSRKSNESKYLTVIRNLESGAILFVGDGKGIRALEGAKNMLKKSELRLVAMDMSNAYSSWFREHFPEAKIVFDHFHIIKLRKQKYLNSKQWQRRSAITWTALKHIGHSGIRQMPKQRNSITRSDG